MPQRSQARKEENHGRRAPPPITGILPDTATIAAAGVVGRVVATLSTTGGQAPFVYTISSAFGMSINIVGNEIRTTVDPCGTAGPKSVQIKSTDAAGQQLTQPVVVTVT